MVNINLSCSRRIFDPAAFLLFLDPFNLTSTSSHDPPHQHQPPEPTVRPEPTN